MGLERRGGEAGRGQRSKVQTNGIPSERTTRVSQQQELHSRIEVFFFLFQGGKSFSCAMTHTLGWCGSRGFRGLSTAPPLALADRRSDPLSSPFVFVPFKEEAIAPQQAAQRSGVRPTQLLLTFPSCLHTHTHR
jgi:hypothetical protein